MFMPTSVLPRKWPSDETQKLAATKDPPDLSSSARAAMMARQSCAAWDVYHIYIIFARPQPGSCQASDARIASLTKSNLHLTECLPHSNLAEPESTSPIFVLEFHTIWLQLKGLKVESSHPPITRVAR